MARRRNTNHETTIPRNHENTKPQKYENTKHEEQNLVSFRGFGVSWFRAYDLLRRLPSRSRFALRHPMNATMTTPPIVVTPTMGMYMFRGMPGIDSAIDRTISTTPRMHMSRALFAFASYHTHSSANVAGIRKPYRPFGPIHRNNSGTARRISTIPVPAGSSTCSVMAYRVDVRFPGAGPNEDHGTTRT